VLSTVNNDKLSKFAALTIYNNSFSRKEEQLTTYEPFSFTNTCKQTDDHMTNTSTTEPEAHDMEFTETHIQYYYIILGIICFIPAVLFAVHHRVNGEPIRNKDKLTAPSDSITFKGCTTPLSVTAVLAFLLSFLFFATQQSYSNLVTTFAVYSSLHFDKSQAVYLSSVFWTAMCIGRLIGKFRKTLIELHNSYSSFLFKTVSDIKGIGIV